MAMLQAHDTLPGVPAFICTSVAEHGTDEQTTASFPFSLEHVSHEYVQGPRMKACSSARNVLCQVAP